MISQTAIQQSVFSFTVLSNFVYSLHMIVEAHDVGFPFPFPFPAEEKWSVNLSKQFQ